MNALKTRENCIENKDKCDFLESSHENVRVTSYDLNSPQYLCVQNTLRHMTTNQIQITCLATNSYSKQYMLMKSWNSWKALPKKSQTPNKISFVLRPKENTLQRFSTANHFFLFLFLQSFLIGNLNLTFFFHFITCTRIHFKICNFTRIIILRNVPQRSDMWFMSFSAKRAKYVKHCFRPIFLKDFF